MRQEGLGTPSQGTGAEHCPQASGPDPQAGPLPPAITSAPDQSQPGQPGPSARFPAAATPRGRQRGNAFSKGKALGARVRPCASTSPPPGKGRQGGRGPVPTGAGDHHPLGERHDPPDPQLSAPHLVAEAAGRQQVRAGRAVAAHGLLAAGAGQRVRHVAQGVGPRGRQGLGEPARHGEHRPERAAEAPLGRRSVRGPAPAGLEAAAAAATAARRHLSARGAGLGWAGCSALRAPAPRPSPAVRSHLGRWRPASTATPPSPLAPRPRGAWATREGGEGTRGTGGGRTGGGQPRPARRPAGSAPGALGLGPPSVQPRLRETGPAEAARRAQRRCLTEIGGGIDVGGARSIPPAFTGAPPGSHAWRWGLWSTHVGRDLLAFNPKWKEL